MKRTLSAVAIALLTLTSCSTDTTAGPVETVDTTPVAEQPSPTTLDPGRDSYEVQIMFQWIPESPDQQPAEARYIMSTTEDGVGYSTPGLSYDVLPSMDSGVWEKYTYQLPSGGNASGAVYINDYPSLGRLSCVAVEVTQQVVLDYQESGVGEDTVTCYAFTHDDHDYVPGTPPVDVTF